MAFAKRSRLRKPRLRTLTVLIRLLMPSAGPLVARRMIALTIPQRCSPDHASGLQDRLQIAVRCPFQPPVPSGQRPGSAPIVPEVRGRFLQLPGLGGPAGARSEPRERQLFGVRLPSGAFQPLPLGAHQDPVSLLHQRPMLRPPDLVHRVAEVLGHVEPVERDLHHGVRDHRQSRRDVGPPHVHADALDGLPVLLSHALVERQEHILAPSRGDMHDMARLRIRHHGHVPVPAAERGFVHRKAPNRLRLAARKSPRHRTLHDSVHRVPAQPHPAGDRLDARFLQPRDHFRLELGRVPRTPLRPRHLNRHHPVLRALDPRDVADQKGLVAPGVQVPPLAAACVVARARLAAVGTPQRAHPGPVQLHPKLLRLTLRLHPGDLPLRTQAQNGVQPVSSGHVCEFLSVSLWTAAGSERSAA